MTNKKQMKEIKTLTKEAILDIFIDYVEQKFKRPLRLAQLAEFSDNELEEFSAHYKDVFEIEKALYSEIFKQTIITLESDPAYADYDSRLKLLSFYYTFFENINLNTELFEILFLDVKSKIASFSSFGDLRKSFQNYIAVLNIEWIDLMFSKANKLSEKAIEELAWGQLLLTLQYWASDTSPERAKTDIFIEKSVNTSFDLLDTKAVKSMLDLGKFLFNKSVKN